MVHEFFGIHGPWFFEIQCPTIFCDFGLFNRLAQAGGGALLYDISLPKTYRPKLLIVLLYLPNIYTPGANWEIYIWFSKNSENRLGPRELIWRRWSTVLTKGNHFLLYTRYHTYIFRGSVADSGYFFPDPNFSIPDPGSGSATKDLSMFNLKMFY
jgi:hypothetical protein